MAPHCLKTVGELAQHGHTGSAASTSLTGQLNSYYGWGVSSSGIVTAKRDGASPNGGSGNSNTNSATINASHGHTISINNAGNNQAHNNIMPYITTYIWQRIA